MKEKGWLEGVIQNEAMMSPEEKMIYEIFGGRDTIVNNLMKQFDSDGDLLNANGVAGMDVTGKGTSCRNSQMYLRNIVKKCLIM